MADSTVRIEVEVLSETGGPLRQAEVRLVPQTGGEPRDTVSLASTPDGFFEAQVPAGRRYRLLARAPGHHAAERVLEAGALGERVTRLTLFIDPYELPEIRAETRRPGGAPSTGRTVTRIRFPEHSLAYTSLGEWLAEQPGLVVRRSGAGGGQVVTVRGSRPQAVLVLLDGVPLNDPLTGSADLSGLPTATLETATLLRGAASTHYGSGASAGVLLLTSRAPRGTRAHATIGAGSFGERLAEGHAALAGRRARAAASVAARAADNDFPYSNHLLAGAPTEHRRNADESTLNVALSAAARPLWASARFDRDERGAPGRIGTSLFDQARWSDERWQAAVGADLAAPRLTAGLAFQARRLSYSPASTSDPSEQSIAGWRASGEAAPWGAEGPRLTGRLSVESISGDGIEGAPSRAAIGGSAAWRLVAGSVIAEPGVGVDVTEGTWAVSPEVAAEARPWDQWRLWTRLGRGFRVATFADMYFASSMRLRPDPDLEPEKVVLDAEAGVGSRLSPGDLELEWSFTGHYRRTRDPIVWLASAAAVWSPQNLESLEAWGAEAQGTLGTAGAAEAGWRLRLAASVTRSRLGFGTNRNPMPYEPGATLFVGSEVWDRLRGLRVQLRVTGSRTTTVAATRRLSPFAVLDIAASHVVPVPGVPLEVTLRVENVLDARYELVELFPEPGRRFELRLKTR